eukprot:2281714-Pyramimonas_sp.AAC.1
MSISHSVRSVVFQPSTGELHNPPARRGRGRPRAVWSREAQGHTVHACVHIGLRLSDIVVTGDRVEAISPGLHP